MKFYGVMIGTEDAKKLADFYTKFLGEPGFKDDNGEFFGYEVGSGLMIGSHSEVHGKNADAPRMILNFSVDDVKASFEEIKAAGADVVAEPYQPDLKNSPDMWLATVADPDGNYIQLSLPWKQD